VAACALAHDDVASLVVDDGGDTDFGPLGFCHDCKNYLLFEMKFSGKRKKEKEE
jgi:hypothetical protein